jgi:hypothetical protein
MDSWHRPDGLTALAATVPVVPGREGWAELVARATAADTLTRVNQDLAEGDAAEAASVDELPTDFLGVWAQLASDAVEAGGAAAADLFAQFQELSEDQVRGLTDAMHDTAVELRVQELVDAAEMAEVSDDATGTGDPDGEAPAEQPPTAEEEVVQAVRMHARNALARSGLPTRLPTGLGDLPGIPGIPGTALVGGLVDGGALTAQARSVAGSLVPMHALNEFVPEVAVVSLAASAGMRLRNGESVDDVKQWLVGELSTMGVANAAMMSVQLLSGLVVLRPLAVLGAKWGRARADTSAQATVAIRAAREKLAPLLGI